MTEDIRALIAKTRKPGQEVPCPRCRAATNRPCTSRTGAVLHNLHASRYEAAGLPTTLTWREPTCPPAPGTPAS